MIDRKRCLQSGFIAAGIFWAVLAPQPASALIEVGKGNEPVGDPGWPAGALEVANLKCRVGWWVGPPLGGGMHVFLYRVDATAQLNEALKLFAAIQTTKLVVVLHDGPHESFALRDHDTPKEPRGDRRLGGLRRAQPQPDARVDFKFTVWNPASWHRLYNSPRGVFFSDRPQFHQPVDPPTLDIYVGGGNVRGDELQLPDAVEVRDERRASSPVDLSDGGVIRGRVFDMATGKPIAGAALAAVEHVAGEGGYSLKELGQAVTGDDGRYEMHRLKRDPGEIHIVADGYAPRAVALDRQDLPIYRSLDVELMAEGSVAGRILDADGQPMPDVTVGLTSVLAIDGRGYRSPTRLETMTDAEGRFQLKGLPHGYAQLSYRKAGYYASPLGELLPVPGEPIEVAMQRTGKIRGKVAAAGGQMPAHVSLDQEGKRPGTWGGVGTWGGGMQVDAEGRFEFDGAPPGKYRVQFQGKTKVVTLAGGQTVEVDFDDSP